MSIAAIHDTIAMALRHEEKTGHLAQLLEQHVCQKVHIAIQLPQENPAASLLELVIAYIKHVPDFLEASHAITQDANIKEYAEPFLQLAEDFFLKPPEIVAGHIGLDELMDEAYLAHRLMEEINDRFMLRAGIPLIPMDMTMSNLIIHSLIGEPFANELDEAVHYIAQRTTLNERVYDTPEFKAYIALHKNNQWEHEYQHWPCLMDRLPINLQFPYYS